MGCGSMCEGCSLEASGTGFTSVEIGSRYTQTKLMIVGEAAAQADASEGLPLRPYTRAGSLFSDSLRESNITRADMAITTIIRCRPPKDWVVGAPYLYSSSQQCLTNYIHSAIAELQPRVIVAMGDLAYRSLVAAPKGRSGLLDVVRGYAWPGAGVAEGFMVIPTYEPGLLRAGGSELIPLLQRDIRRAFLIATDKLKEGENYILNPLENKGRYQTAPTISEAWEWFNSIDPNRSIYADIETPRSKREDEDDRNSFADRDINLIQFTQRRGEGIALPWRDDYRDVARAVLATGNRKVGHNWFGFDLPVLAANGIEVNGEQDDTMLQFHHYHPDLPQNLQAVAQFCGFPFAWKHLADSEQELYGCLDVDATCWADETMTALLRRDGLYASYERYVRQFWPILRDMSARGLPVSDERRLALKDVIVEEGLRADAAIKEIVPEEVLAQKQKEGYKNPPILTCSECGWKGRVDHLCMPSATEDGEMLPVKTVLYSEMAEENGLMLREVVVKEKTKCRCKKAERSGCDVCAGAGIIPAGLVEMRWAALTEFNPNSSQQVKRYMRYRKHPVPKHAKRTDASGDASETTEVKELERLYVKTKDPIYPLLIEKRQLTKIDGTYAEGWKPGRDGRIHTTFTFKPATWQTSSREPNCQNGLKHGKTIFQKRLAKSFNGMLCAEPGHLMVNVDAKSFHAQTTACEFGLPDYLRLAKIDIHSFVTCHYLKLPERVGLLERPDEEMREIFKKLKKGEVFKFCRDYKAKRTILGIQFAMFHKKLYQLNPDDFDNPNEAKALWELIMIQLFPGLKKGQDAARSEAAEQKFLMSKYGAIRRFNDVQRWDWRQQKMVSGDQAEAAVAFKPAANAFGYMREFMIRIHDLGWDEKYQLVNSIHDSIVLHCPKGLVDECVWNMTTEMAKPSEVLVYPKTAPLGLSVEAEAAVGPDLANMEEVKA
jgi:uracil-DNA glycosylase family 4